VYCGHLVVTPDVYREALDAAERSVEGDALTREAFRRLGKPPPLLLRYIWGAFFDGCGSVLFLSVVVFFSCVWLLTHAMDRAPLWFEVDAYDWLSEQEMFLVIWGSTFSIVATLLVLGAIGSRHAIELGRLQAALAAKPPVLEGGPSTCRECGAPLVVADDAVGVRCLYCRADNLVAIPPVWLERATRRGKSVVREAESALEADHAEGRKLRLRLLIGLGLLATLAVLITKGLVADVFRGESPGVFDIRAAFAHDRTLFDVDEKRTDSPAQAVAPTLVANGCRAPTTVAEDRMSCVFDHCDSTWFVALHAGETLSFQMDATGTAMLYEHDGNRVWRGDYPANWGFVVATKDLAPNIPIALRAPVTTFYRLSVETPDTGEARKVCASIEPR
jgi:hypothetical protein